MRDKPPEFNGTIPWIRIEDFDGKYIYGSKSNQNVSETTIRSMNLKVFPVGTVLCSCSCRMGATAIVMQPLISNQTFIGIVPGNNLDSDFLFYATRSFSDHLQFLATGAIQQYLSREDFHQLRFYVPPLDEQRAIAAFLDRETERIDTLIAKKEQQMELLQEKRAALISHVVTKGLNPNVKMKHSGIEWLGEIPEHWEVKPLKYIKAKMPNAFVDGPFGSNLKSIHFVHNGDVFVIESEFATRGKLNIDNLKTTTSEHFETIQRSEVKAGDIVIAKIGAYFGLSNILPQLPKPAVVSGNSMKLTVNRETCFNRFIHYQLLKLKWSGSIDLLAGTTAQPALSLGGMNALKLALPKLEEQIDITTFLDMEARRIEELSQRIRVSIDLLIEHRSALISAAVTGKIDVRKEVA